MANRTLIASEADEQRALVQWIQLQGVFNDLLIKLNNEGKRTAAQGSNLKRMGLLRGASDLFLAYPSDRFHGLWLEVKQARKYTPSERRTPTWLAQERFLSRMREMGYDGYFCYGWEHGKAVIEAYVRTDRPLEF